MLRNGWNSSKLCEKKSLKIIENFDLYPIFNGFDKKFWKNVENKVKMYEKYEKKLTKLTKNHKKML